MIQQYACVVVKGVYQFVNLPIKCNDVGQRGGSSHFCSFPAVLMFSQNKLFKSWGLQNKHCGSVQKLHLTRGVCEPQRAPSLGEVYCTGQAKCVSIKHESPAWSQGQNPTEGPLALCRAPRTRRPAFTTALCKQGLTLLHSCTVTQGKVPKYEKKKCFSETRFLIQSYKITNSSSGLHETSETQVRNVLFSVNITS